MHAAAGMRSDRGWQIATMIRHDVPRRFVSVFTMDVLERSPEVTLASRHANFAKGGRGFQSCASRGTIVQPTPAILGEFFLARVNSPISLVLLFQVRGVGIMWAAWRFVFTGGDVCCVRWDLNNDKTTRSRPGWGSV